MEKWFIVDITRTETYTHEVKVKAENELEASRKVMIFDENNGFETEWNEGHPTVDTEYDAEAIDTTVEDDATFAEIPEVS